MFVHEGERGFVDTAECSPFERRCKRVPEGTVYSVLAVPHLKLRHVLFAPWRSSSCELSCLRRMMAFECWLVGVHTLIDSVPPDSGLLLGG